jgi:hypothetical protein
MFFRRTKLTSVDDVKLLLTATLGAVDKVAIGTAAIYGLREGLEKSRCSLLVSYHVQLTRATTGLKIYTFQESNIHGLDPSCTWE